MFFAVEIDLSAGVFAEKDSVVDLDVEGSDFTVVTEFSFALA